MDFGIARITDSDTRLTKTGFSVGTAAYLAPEQIEGEVAGPASDIFAYGLVAYELLTFHRAFKGPTVSSLMYQILHSEPDPISTLQPRCPQLLEDVISRCLAKELDQRYRSFDEVRADLLEVAADLGVAVEESGVLQSRRHRRTAVPSAGYSKTDLTQPTRAMVTPKPGKVRGAAEPASESIAADGIAPSGLSGSSESSRSSGLSKGVLAVLLVVALVGGFVLWRWLGDRETAGPVVDSGTVVESSGAEVSAEEDLPAPREALADQETDPSLGATESPAVTSSTE
jgi:serine/threonine protein kinase